MEDRPRVDEVGVIGFAQESYLMQMPDSVLESTRVFWRQKFWDATDKEARDPRPWAQVLAERETK